MGRDEGEGSGEAPSGPRSGRRWSAGDQPIDAAYQLIAAEGPHGLSMRKLATALHVSLPTVYTAVDSRETLSESCRTGWSTRSPPPSPWMRARLGRRPQAEDECGRWPPTCWAGPDNGRNWPASSSSSR